MQHRHKLHPCVSRRSITRFRLTSFGHANRHVAGGGFKHAGHVLYDRQKNRPLSNLYVRMLHQMGIEADKFGTSTGVISDIG